MESDLRAPGEAVSFQTWIAQHPRHIKQQYGDFCDTPLHLAARFGREDLVGPLIAAGADVEARNGLDDRPLHVAARRGRTAVVQLLLARGAGVDASGREGRTPLHAAASGLDAQNLDGRIEVAKLLLAAGADVNARVPGDGSIPFRFAMAEGTRNRKMVDLLLAHGADPRSAGEAAPPSTRAH